MAAGSPDLVDCARLAEAQAVLHRVYGLGDLPRLRGVLAGPEGTLRANFAFAKVAQGRTGADVTIEARPQLTCQRCLQVFDLVISGGSRVEFTSAGEAAAVDAERELFWADDGQVSLRELAEEELLLALPVAPACSTPETCGKAPGRPTGDETSGMPGDARRPFSVLQDLMKKT